MCMNENERFLGNSATAKQSYLTAKEKEVAESLSRRKKSRGVIIVTLYNEYISEERAAIGKYVANNDAINLAGTLNSQKHS